MSARRSSTRKRQRRAVMNIGHGDTVYASREVAEHCPVRPAVAPPSPQQQQPQENVMAAFYVVYPPPPVRTPPTCVYPPPSSL